MSVYILVACSPILLPSLLLSAELAMDAVVPVNGVNHVYEKPGPRLQQGHVVTNQLYERSSDDEGAPYEEPISMSQFGVPPELRLSGSVSVCSTTLKRYYMENLTLCDILSLAGPVSGIFSSPPSSLCSVQLPPHP